MIRFLILFGFALMLSFIHMEGNLNKYINTKYAYLSISAIVLLSLLCLIEFVRIYRLEALEERRNLLLEHAKEHDHNHFVELDHELVGKLDLELNHEHSIGYSDELLHDHAHGGSSKLKRTIGYLILLFPIFTGIFLPVQTLDSSFVKAKGFSFPQFEAYEYNPGQHQFLKPDTSIFYGFKGYEKVKNKELAEFSNDGEITLSEKNYLKGLEVIYNFPGAFMGKTINIEGFAYKGKQGDQNHFFVFRFGFIHCAADSGVFGMLADFPKGTRLKNDEWVHVTGILTKEFYQPFKQTIPVLKVTNWSPIAVPKDLYVYRTY